VAGLRARVCSVFEPQTSLAGHPDRLRWNARYEDGFVPSFAAHPLALHALWADLRAPGPQAPLLPPGPVLDLASGPSGSVLLAASAGRLVTAVDVSDGALRLLGAEASRRGLLDLVSLVHADLQVWRPPRGTHALVLCTGYWDRALFGAAADAVAPGGLLGWEAFSTDALRSRPSMPAAWCLEPGEPASLLPAEFAVSYQSDLPGGEATAKRQMLAWRRTANEWRS
jgi:hypothetical protein